MGHLAWGALLAALVGAPPEGGWRLLDGSWDAETSSWLTLLRQAAPTGRATALSTADEAAGGCWRVLVELGPTTREAGLWVQTGGGLDRGWLLTLGRGEQAGLRLRDVDGKVLWQDAFLPWTLYTPYCLEAVIEPGRLRVQALRWDKRTLLSQSDWLAVPEAATAQAGRLALQSVDGAARFYGWEHAPEPLSPVVEDAPNKLRLEQGEGAPWHVNGPGEWRWTGVERTRLHQFAEVERSTAVYQGVEAVEGTWRCRVSVDPGTGGAGLAFGCNNDVDSGFIVWLGGTPGNGGLMLYRLPVDALWSSPQGVWKYDTEYLLEATIRDGKASAKLFAADGAELASSPERDLRPDEIGRAGRLGFMTWRGQATFWDFLPGAAATPAAASPLGQGWQVDGGTWQRPDAAAKLLHQTSAEAVCSALDPSAKAAPATWRVTVEPGEGAKAVGLLFQVDPELKEGFLCRLGDRVTIETVAGRTLWQSDPVAWQTGHRYLLEAHVDTDRVSARVADAEGTVLAESVAVYVSDTNNERPGALGFRTEGGPATFSQWAVE